MSPHLLPEENNKSLLISVPNISRLKMNGLDGNYHPDNGAPVFASIANVDNR